MCSVWNPFVGEGDNRYPASGVGNSCEVEFQAHMWHWGW